MTSRFTIKFKQRQSILYSLIFSKIVDFHTFNFKIWYFSILLTEYFHKGAFLKLLLAKTDPNLVEFPLHAFRSKKQCNLCPLEKFQNIFSELTKLKPSGENENDHFFN